MNVLLEPVSDNRDYHVKASLVPTDTAGVVLPLLDLLALIWVIFFLSHAWIYPSQTTTDVPPGIELANLLYNAVCLYCFLRILFLRAIAVFLQEKLLLALILLGFLSIFYSVSPSNTIGMVRLEFLSLSAFLFFSMRFSRDVIIRCFINVIGIVLLLSVMASLTGLGVMQGFDAGRWRGLFGHKNSLGEVAAIFLAISFAYWRAAHRINSYILVYILAALLCVAFAGSATALSALAFMILVISMAEFSAKTALTSGLRAFSFYVLFLFAGWSIFTIVPQVVEMLGRDLTFTGRTEIWEMFLFFADQRPWTGWGWATIGTNENMLGYIRETLGLPHIQTPHNSYILLVVELGYPAAAVFVAWLLTKFVYASQATVARRHMFETARISIVAGLALHSVFEGVSGVAPSLWLFLLVALGGRQSKLKQPEITKEPKSQRLINF